MGPPISPDLRCPRCNAHVQHDAQWCTLCYADLRRAPEPEPVDAPEVAAEPAQPVDASAARPASAAPLPTGADPMLGWLTRAATATSTTGTAPVGRHSRRRATDASAALSGVDVEAMLAVLAAESDSGLGPLAGRVQSKGAKAIVIAGGIGVVCLVLFLVMAVLGTVL